MTNICEKCRLVKDASEMITLLCNHSFCWSCIETHLKDNLKNKVKCPCISCTKFMNDKEIRNVLSNEDIQKYDDICRSMVPNSHICLLPGCGMVFVYDESDIQFNCTRCTAYNCVNCKMAHKGIQCESSLTRNELLWTLVCQEELKRAERILQEKVAQEMRASIEECDKSVLMANLCVFTCEICCKDIAKKGGVMLRGCFHEICRSCLREHVKNSATLPVSCPFSPCKSILEDRECREILSMEDKLIYENKSLAMATKDLERPDHCRQYNCDYICELSVDVHSWTCPACRSTNCVECRTIHNNQTCQEYVTSKVASKDEKNIEDLIKLKKLMRCPDCTTLIKKTRGCNWIPCPKCGIELCWVNQMYRWGPNGPGDTSGGCRCGVDGQYCHPTCRGCIADIGRRHTRYASLTTSQPNYDMLTLFGRADGPLRLPRRGTLPEEISPNVVREPGDLRRWRGLRLESGPQGGQPGPQGGQPGPQRGQPVHTGNSLSTRSRLHVHRMAGRRSIRTEEPPPRA